MWLTKLWSWWTTKFLNCPLAQQVWHYAANIIWQLFAKRANLGTQKSFSMTQCLFDQSLSKSLKRFSRIGSSWEAIFRGLFVIKGIIWFLMLFNGRWRKHTKFCGIPYVSGKRLSQIWKRHRLVLMVMFLMNLPLFGVSKVLLLLGKLDPGWALLFKSPHFLYFPWGGCTFRFAIEFTFNLCQEFKKSIY